MKTNDNPFVISGYFWITGSNGCINSLIPSKLCYEKFIPSYHYSC